MSDTLHDRSIDEPFGRQLARLAPSVDTAAGRALFDRRRAEIGGSGDGPRWWLAAAVLALVIGGIVGLWALTRDESTTPASEPDDPTDETAGVDGQIIEGRVEPGGGFEVFYVAETPEPYGQAWLVNDLDDPEYDAMMRPHPDVPEPDLGRSAVLATIQPDNACPDTLVRFEVAPDGDGVPVWTPVFEEQATECNDPLLSWLYVVMIDRAALGGEAIIRLPADEVFDVDEQLLRYRADSADDRAPAADEPDVVLEPAGITSPLPPVGEPAIHNTSAGLIWVVSHDDGSASVLPATVDAPTDEDEGGVTNLSVLVTASESGQSFTGGRFVWDAWGRATNGGRANDLVGYAGRVDGDDVEILTSTATRVPGEAVPPPGTETYDLPDLGQPIDVPTFLTLSSSGPIWRYFDAALVVEDGVGRICQVDATVPVDQLATCDDADFVLDTAVTSTQTEITAWYPAPILAFQDPIRQFTEVIPLGGTMSLNTAAVEDAPEPTIPALTDTDTTTDPASEDAVQPSENSQQSEEPGDSAAVSRSVTYPAPASVIAPDASGVAATRATPLPDFDGAIPGDDESVRLPLGAVSQPTYADRLDFLYERGPTEGYGSTFRDAVFVNPDDPTLVSGPWQADRPFVVRHGFVNDGPEPLGSGFDVVIYATPLDAPSEFDGIVIGPTRRYTSDYVVRESVDQCGPNYRTQAAPVTCEWFVHDFPDGLPNGRWALWAFWQAPCRAWIVYGFVESCADPEALLSLFASGVDSPWEPDPAIWDPRAGTAG